MRFLDIKLAKQAERGAELVMETPHVRLYRGKAETWRGPEMIDLVFTNPYGPLPASLHHMPMIVHQWVHRADELRAWIGGAELHVLSGWNRDDAGTFRECFYMANMEAGDGEPIIERLREEGGIAEFKPEPGGWYHEGMVRRLLASVDTGLRPFTIWDGFCGRGTVGKVAVSMGMKYVGVDQLDTHLTLAKNFLREK